MPDGSLKGYHDELAASIVETSLESNITSLFSLGEDGFDGHQDHISSHEAVVAAAGILRYGYGRDVRHYSLNSRHSGEQVVFATHGSRARKLGAMACHQSQFDISRPGTDLAGRLDIHGHTVGEEFWSGFKPYHPLITDKETYDLNPVAA